MPISRTKTTKIRQLAVALLLCAIPFTGKCQAPTITSFSPDSGPIGTSVTIHGTGFGSTAANNIVVFGATTAIINSASATSLVVAVPMGATYVPFTVINTTTGLSVSSDKPFAVTFVGGGISGNGLAPQVDITTPGLSTSFTILADLDGDGKSDLIAVNLNHPLLSVFQNISVPGVISTSSFSAPVHFFTGQPANQIAIADIDGDGKPEIVVAKKQLNLISIFRNTSTSGIINSSSFDPKVDFTTGQEAKYIAIGDIDGDGKHDLVVSKPSNNSIGILRNTSGSGTIDAASFEPVFDVPVNGSPGGIALGDIDSDGKVDILFGFSLISSVGILKNNANPGPLVIGSFLSEIDFPAGQSPLNPCVGDLDGDGKLDIAVANLGLPGTITVFRNTASLGIIDAGTFASPISIPSATSPFYTAIADMDGDGKQDLLVANNSNSVSIFRNVSSSGTLTSGSFMPKHDFAVGYPGFWVTIGDLDGDQKPDVVLSDHSSSTISIFRNDPKPVIYSFSPTSGGPGTSVTITGAKLSGTTAIAFGGVAASSFLEVDDHTMVAQVASGATGFVSIANPHGNHALPGFTFNPVYEITSFSPIIGTTGTLVTIRGRGFNTVTSVRIGAPPAASFTILNDSTITATVGTGSSGSIRVGSIAGIATLAYFTFFDPLGANHIWEGDVSADYNLDQNWSLGVVPNCCDCKITIHQGLVQPILSTSGLTCGEIVMDIGATLTISPDVTFTICGNVGMGSILGAGNVTLVGDSPLSLGGKCNFQNLKIGKAAGTGDVTILGQCKIFGSIYLSQTNLIVDPSASLTLVSNQNGTGSIGPIIPPVALIGKITQQRYLPGNAGAWFFVGTPILNSDFSQWTDDIYMAAGTNLGGHQGIVATGIQHSTFFKYDDSFHQFTTDEVQHRGWRVPILGDAPNPGNGYRIWLKQNPPNRILDNFGNINQGPFDFPTLQRTEHLNCQPHPSPATFPCNESYRGWNLLANPYPSAVDWDALGAWTKPPQMLNAVYRWNSAGMGYNIYASGIFAGSGPAPAFPNLIANGQAFFVKLINPGVYNATLSISENAKSIGVSTFLRSTTQTANQFKIRLFKPETIGNYDYTGVVQFLENATDGHDLQQDIPNFPGSQFYFAMPVGNQEMIINSLSLLEESKIVSLVTRFQGSLGMHHFEFTGLETFASDVAVFLKDNWLGTLTDVNQNPVYPFEVNGSNMGITNRFELIFNPFTVTGTLPLDLGMSFDLTPNPVFGNSQIQFSLTGFHSQTNLQVVDVFGKKIYQSLLIPENGKTEHFLTIPLPAGIYLVQVLSQTGSISKKLVVQE